MNDCPSFSAILTPDVCSTTRKYFSDLYTVKKILFFYEYLQNIVPYLTDHTKVGYSILMRSCFITPYV